VGRRHVAVNGDGSGRRRNEAQRNKSRERSGFDARERVNASDHLLLKILGALRAVAGAVEIDLSYENVASGKTGAGVAHFVKALQEQRGAEQKHEAERDLHEDES